MQSGVGMNNRKKNLLKTLMIGLFFGAPCGAIKSETGVDAARVGSPESTGIAFDFHNVIGKFDWSYGKKHPGFLKKLSQYGLAFGSAAVLSYCLLGANSLLLLTIPAAVTLTFATRFAFFAASKKRRPVIEQFVKKDPILGYANSEFVELESLYIPNEEIVALMKQLRANGYTIVLASNIAPGSLALLQERYPEVFEYFKVDGKLQAVTPAKENGWLDKKQPSKYYQELVSLCGKEQVIFIDDSDKNCKNAEKSSKNIKAICFTGSIEDLRQQLRAQKVQI